MPSFHTFFNFNPICHFELSTGQLGLDVVLYNGSEFSDTFISNITYKGTDASQWFGFIIGQTSDVVVAGVLNRSGGTTRFTDNNQDQADAVQLWVADNMLNAPGTTWQNEVINFAECRIDVIQDAATTPVTRSYIIQANGRQSSLTRQPGAITVEVFRNF
jgi:hypothetical protein